MKKDKTPLFYFDNQNSNSLCWGRHDVHSSGNSEFLSAFSARLLTRSEFFSLLHVMRFLIQKVLLKYVRPVLAILLLDVFTPLKGKKKKNKKTNDLTHYPDNID